MVRKPALKTNGGLPDKNLSSIMLLDFYMDLKCRKNEIQIIVG